MEANPREIELLSALRRVEAELAAQERRHVEFLHRLADQLRNALAPLVNALHLLDQPDVDPDVATAAGGILRRQVHALLRLVAEALPDQASK